MEPTQSQPILVPMKPNNKKWIVIAIIILILGGGIYYFKNQTNMSLLSKLGVVKLTPNEDKGVKEILATYGGKVKSSVGVSALATLKLNGYSTTSNKYFEIKLSDSDTLEAEGFKGHEEWSASNILYLFIKNLGNEKTNYQSINVVFSYKDGSQRTEKFPLDEETINRAELISKKMIIVNKIVDLLKNKDYNPIKLMISNTSPFIKDKDVFIASVEKAESTFGAITEFKLYGFGFPTLNKDGTELLKIYGMTFRDKGENIEFSVILDPNSLKEEILALDYSWRLQKKD